MENSTLTATLSSEDNYALAYHGRATAGNRIEVTDDAGGNDLSQISVFSNNNQATSQSGGDAVVDSVIVIEGNSTPL